MLQKTDKHTQEILDLANFIEGLDPDRFSLGSWGMWQEPRCICGWLMHNRARADKDNWRDAAEILGIDESTAHGLFCNASTVDNKQAAKILRHLAVTGEVNLFV